MGSHVIDWIMLQNNFGTAEMRDVWNDHNRLQKHLDVEAALALAEGELGVIPKEAAQEIAKQASAKNMNIEEIAAKVAVVKHSLTPTISALQNLAGDSGEYVHYGATTQDIVDTGAVLQLKEAFAIIYRDLQKVANTLKDLARKYQHTPMPGRSHGMQALPTTFGFKVAVWLDECIRHLQRLTEIKDRVLTGNISGAIGTYASFGEQGPAIEALALSKLGLNTPVICWQSARDRFSEYASVAALISGTLGKIGNELYNLMRTEIDEIEEPFSIGKIGSTTMPHKRNPAAFEGLASLTNPILKSAALMHDSLKVEHERDAMSWRVEWIALPEINIYLSSQLATALTVLSNLTVKEENMQRNLELQHGLLLSEKVMFEVGRVLGKQTAHHIVYECAMKAFEEKRSFQSVLLDKIEIKASFSEDEVAGWLVPSQYLGSAVLKVDEVIAHAEASGLLTSELGLVEAQLQ